jgi:hypothetical protein
MAGKQFTIRRKVFTLFGAKFHIYNDQGGLLGFSQQKAFRLKEDIRVYTDETSQDERFQIAARNIIDFSAAYDVIDSRQDQKVGALQRKGFKSLFRDHWTVLDENDAEIGSIQEDSSAMALLRRGLNLGTLLPQTFHLRQSGGVELAEFRTHFNPFVHRMTVDVYPDCPVQPMLVLAAGILLVAIEGRQK